MEKKVSIVLLNFNGEDDTIECLESLKNVDYSNFNVIVVDNNSLKGSVESIVSFLDDDDFYKYDSCSVHELSDVRLDDDTNLLLVLNDVNSGFAGGNNVALNYLLSDDVCDYVLLLNNDTVVSEDFLSALVDTSRKYDDDCFVGINHYYYQDRERVQTIGGGLVDLVHGEASAVTDTGYSGCVDFLTGSCIFTSVDILRDIGVMNEDYFMYWEDVDWSTTLLEHGHEIRISDAGCIYHKEGSSIKSLHRIYYHTRNRILYMKRHTGGLTYYKFIIYIILYVLKEATMNMTKNRAYSKTLISGLQDGIKKVVKK